MLIIKYFYHTDCKTSLIIIIIIIKSFIHNEKADKIPMECSYPRTCKYAINI